LSRSIDSVFFLSFCEYNELRNTRPLESCLVRRNGKFVCLGIQEACWMCLLLYGSQVWFDGGLLPKSYLQNSCQVIIIFFIGHTSCGACLSSSMRPIFSWALPCSGSFSPQLIMLKIPHPYQQLSISVSCTCLSQTRCSILWDSSYPTLTASPSTKGLWYRYHPIFFF
jgi:hypothetical protein